MGIYIVQFVCLIWAHGDNSFVSTAGEVDEAMSIQDVQRSFQSLPIILIVAATFTFVYRLSSNQYPIQACQMNLVIFGGKQVNGNVVNLAHNVAVMIAIGLLETVIYPALERRRKTVSLTTKFVTGLILAGLSALVALIFEWLRRGSGVHAWPGWYPDAPREVRFPNMTFYGDGDYAWANFQDFMGVCMVNGVDYCSNCAPQTIYPETGVKIGIYMSNMSAWWMCIPFFIVGVAEALVTPVLQYFAYAVTPAGARSMIQAALVVFTGMYPLASVTIFTTLLAKCFKNNLNLTTKILGIPMGIDAFYWLAVVFTVPAVPVAICVIRRSKVEAPTVRHGASESFVQSVQSVVQLSQPVLE